ncbi:MAG TPA: shikimate kinase [Pyrinomonadaceae bacterium]
MNARPPQRRIVLTGFMCAGKSTVARALAARLGCAMLDTDAWIVEREGRGIEAIIEGDGEPRFRQIERDALGGGTWASAENRSLIAAHRCLTVWLDAPFDLCWRRIADSHDARPLARERERARQLYEARRAAYELAALRVEITEGRNAEDTAAEIASIIERRNFLDEYEGRGKDKADG